MNEYRELMRIPGTWRLLISSLPGRIAYSMVGLAMFFHVKELTGSLSSAGLAVGASSLVSSATASLRGHAVDRWGQTKPLLVLAPAWSISCFLLGYAAKDTASAVALAAISGATAAPINLSVRPLWKELVGERMVRTAYALDTVVLNGLGLLGPVIGTWAALNLGGPIAMYLTGSLMLVGGLALVTNTVSRAWVPEPKEDGQAGIFRHRAIQLLIIEGALIGFGFGLFDIGVPAAASIANIPEWSAISLGAASLGGLLGGALAGSRFKSWAPGQGLLNTQRMFVVMSLPLALVAPGWQTALLLLVAGFPLGMAQVFYLEVIDIVRPKGTAVTAQATIWFIEGSAAALGSAIAGLLSEEFSPTIPLALGPLFFIGSATTLMIGSRGVLKPAMTRTYDEPLEPDEA